jgi:lysophospholipase L1-like esterase
LSELVAVRAQTDSNIYYLDGLQLFNHTEALTMPDGIHPDAAGYRTIAANFVERVPERWLANACIAR